MQTKLPLAAKAHVRWMIRRDMSEVLAIEADSFGEEAWSEEDFHEILRQRNAIGMVVELGDQIAGYMVYEMHKNRLHVLNFAVSYLFRREGIGSKMVEKLKSKLRIGNRYAINLEINERNLKAQLFFRDHGFKCISVLKNFYDFSTLDAYLFRFEVEPR